MLVLGVALCVATNLTIGCSPAGDDPDDGDRAVCAAVQVPAKYLRRKGLTFADIVDPGRPRSMARTIGATLVFTNPAGSTRFEPALSYLADAYRAERDTSRESERPELTDEVVDSARALDEALADGLCSRGGA
jgi:hypothetical protein